MTTKLVSHFEWQGSRKEQTEVFSYKINGKEYFMAQSETGKDGQTRLISATKEVWVEKVIKVLDLEKQQGKRIVHVQSANSISNQMITTGNANDFCLTGNGKIKPVIKDEWRRHCDNNIKSEVVKKNEKQTDDKKIYELWLENGVPKASNQSDYSSNKLLISTQKISLSQISPSRLSRLLTWVSQWFNSKKEKVEKTSTSPQLKNHPPASILNDRIQLLKTRLQNWIPTITKKEIKEFCRRADQAVKDGNTNVKLSVNEPTIKIHNPFILIGANGEKYLVLKVLSGTIALNLDTGEINQCILGKSNSDDIENQIRSHSNDIPGIFHLKFACKIEEAGTNLASYYLMTELGEAWQLFEHPDRIKKRDEWILELAQILKDLHARNISPASLNPMNIRVTDDGHIKIDDPRLLGSNFDPATDMFKFGLIVYQMVTGKSLPEEYSQQWTSKDDFIDRFIPEHLANVEDPKYQYLLSKLLCRNGRWHAESFIRFIELSNQSTTV